MAKRTNRVAWGLAVVLVVMMVSTVGLLVVHLRPYWVAKYRGRDADLRGAVLPFAPLAGAELDCAILTGANLCGANLRGATLRARRVSKWPIDPERGCRVADLTGARLVAADLSQAQMMLADFTGGFLLEANFSQAKLNSATFDRADLREAKFRGADLVHASFCGADLTGADLTNAKLGYARYDAHTRWPSDFDPVKAGAVLVR